MDEPSRPTGTITFLFSDMERSTELAVELGAGPYREVLEQQQRLLREAFAAHGGIERGTEGDSFFVVFRDAPSAVATAVDAQRALAEAHSPSDTALRVRMGIHTGQGLPGGDDYVGIDVNRAARIASAAHGGQVLVSDATRALSIGSLPDGVALRYVGQHRLKGIPEPERLYQLTIAGLPSDFPAVRSLDAPVTNLPVRVSTLVGRERDLEEVEGLIRVGRLVTLLGSGGTGKTSLATEVARRVAPNFPDGAWFVALDSVVDPQLVGSAIVAALNLRDMTGRSARERLLDNLPGRSLLLVLDNFEQIVEAAPLVGELLVVAPTVKAIVTSRAPLRLSAEQVYPVAPLAVPGPADGLDLVELMSVPSVHLFVDRARQVQPDFELTMGNAPAIGDICRRLDGLPLGIELAAARMPLLGPVGILDRLEHQLALSGLGPRDAPERQRTLENTIAWSHDLLDGPSRSLFARLGVFAGGWRLEQAEAVCGPATELGGEVVDILDRLVNQSLVTTNARADAVRFGMLETIRRHASERLSHDETYSNVRRRHMLTYLALAESAAPALEARGAAVALERLGEERENLRTAVRLAVDTKDAQVGLRLGNALSRFWSLSGELEEGAASMLALLAIPGAETPTSSRMRALEAIGNMYYFAGGRERPREMYRAQLELAHVLNDKHGIADARYNLLFVDYGPDDSQGALVELDGIEAAYRELGDERAIARTMWARGSQLVGASRMAEAVKILEPAIIRFRELADYRYQMQAAGSLSAANFALGNPASAARWLLEGVAVAHEDRNLPMTTAGLPSIAMAVFHLGLPEAAAEILGAYDGLSQRYGVRMPENLERLLTTHDPPAQVREALEPDVYDRARARGRQMGIDEAVAFAMEMVGRPAASGSE